MSHPTEPLPGHEPSLHTVEMVCDRLAELGLAVGADTARELVRAVLAAEAPRVDARLREALDTTLQTIRVAAQAAMGVLATTSPADPGLRPAVTARPDERAAAPPPPLARAPAPAPPPRRTPAAGRAAAPRRPEPEPAPPPHPRRPPDDGDELERRPVFRRPRGR